MRLRNIALTGALAMAFGNAQATLFDRGGGMIYDDVKNITWLKDANYGAGSSYDNGSSSTDGRMTWQNAVNWAADLNYADSVRNTTYDDWRLATVIDTGTPGCNYGIDCGQNVDTTLSELAYMFHINLGNWSYLTPSGKASGHCGGAPTYSCLVNTGPFTNLQPSVYWTGTAYAPDPSNYAWWFRTQDGGQVGDDKHTEAYAWAVRDGDVASVAAPVPEPETYAMMLAGLGLLGVVARRRKQKLNA